MIRHRRPPPLGERIARGIAARIQTLEQQCNAIGKQIAQVANRQRELQEAEARFSVQLDAFWTQREVAKAQYDVATAEARISAAAEEFARAAFDLAAGLELERFRAAAQDQPAADERPGEAREESDA